MIKKIAGVLLVAALIAGGFAGWRYFAANYRIAKPSTVKAAISAVEVKDTDHGKKSLEVVFNRDVANMKFMAHDLNEYVKMHPAIKGSWRFVTPSILRFEPEISFLPDTTYHAALAQDIFSSAVRPKDTKFSFSSPKFSGKNISKNFYENPKDGSKSVIATFEFNYPVKVDNIKDKISIKTTSDDVYEADYKYDEEKNRLHIISSPVKIKDSEDFADIKISELENIYNAKKLASPVTARVKIPSGDTFFQLKNFQSYIIRDKNDNPQQVAALKFSTPVSSDELKKYLSIYYTPDSCDYYRQHKNEATDTDKLELKEIPVTGDLKTNLFKYDRERSYGCLIAKIKAGLTSEQGYILKSMIEAVADFVSYPMEVKIVGEGSIIPLDNKHTVEFITRGVDVLDIKVARIDESNLNHLVTQSGGNFSHPIFNSYAFNEDNIAEVFSKQLWLNAPSSSEPVYSSLDLNEYLAAQKGIFFIKIFGKSNDGSVSPMDTRLLVVTDLGIVVKDDAFGDHYIFAMSISGGKPAANAKVEVLGKNGLPILSAETDSDGLAFIPDFKDFKNEKRAVAYKVSLDDDISFLPIEGYDRVLNMSRFDVGGKYDVTQGDYALSGMIFSDRGIYRPGEEAHFGIMVRQNDLHIPSHLPLKAEIYNPNGDMVSSQSFEINNYGLTAIDYKVPASALRGTYWAELYVKGRDNYDGFIAKTSFRVEDFKPENLKLKAIWQNIPSEGWTTSPMVVSLANLQNLYGIPASQAKIKVSYVLTPIQFYFDKYADYHFNSIKNIKNDTQVKAELPDLTTDEEGNAVINIDVSDYAHGAYNLGLTVEGFEKGSGEGVTAFLTAKIGRSPYLIGWRANGDLDFIYKDSERKVDFIAIDNRLKMIEKDDLNLILVKKEKISSLVEMPNGTFGYKMIEKETELENYGFEIAKEGTSVELKTDEPGAYSLKITDKNDVLLSQTDWLVAGALNQGGVIDKKADLNIQLDRSQYASGDEITMQIDAPYTGYGLITIERDKVYAHKWFKMNTRSVLESIELPDTVEGNAYINVAMFRDINSTAIFLPALSYGVAPFDINRDDRKLDIKLTVDKKVKSGEDLVIKYETSHPADIIIYGVNTGILQAARYKMPSPLAVFMPKKALLVVTSQIMDLIMPDIRILRKLSSFGGDDGYEMLSNGRFNPFARKGEEAVSFWSGVVRADSQSREYVYKVPQYFNGEIKIMALGVSDKRFGDVFANVKAHGDFAVNVSAPLNVCPQDEFKVVLNIGNQVEGAGLSYPVTVKLKTDDGFEVIGDKEQSLNIDENKEGTVSYFIKAKDTLGNQDLEFEISSPRSPNALQKVSYSVGVRPFAPFSSQFIFGHASSEYDLSDIVDFYEQYRYQRASASSSPMVLVQSLMRYLDKFPHYCTEQSVSKVFPAIEVFFKYPELVKDMDIYALYADVVAKLGQRQKINGGFSLWTSAALPSDAYSSVYAAHFLLTAQKYGFNVERGMLNRVISYCSDIAGRTPQQENDFINAYAVYVLTLAGNNTGAYLINLEDYLRQNYPKTWKKTLSAAFMAASYELLQNKTKANELVNNYQNGDDPAMNAMNDYLLARHFPEIFAKTGRREISALLAGFEDGNITTSSAAWSVLALNAVKREENPDTFKFNGKAPSMVVPFPGYDFNSQTKEVAITAPKPFYYAIAQQGFVKSDNVKALASGIEVSKNIYDSQGNSVTSAEIGDTLTVEISYKSLDKTYDNVAIIDLLAGTFEVVRDSFASDSFIDSSEVLEDRVLAYVTATMKSKTIRYKVKVIAAGNFKVPPVYASALYNPLVKANSELTTFKADE
ncbi:MAG: alpha-2-macroglobulin family protein [Alphaproteobacteria bacterium]|nr:alpha-2-macroglobulin family protein [Alphaproteobacteria bacterium]